MKPTTIALFTILKIAQRAVLLLAGKHRLMRLIMPVLLMCICMSAEAQPVITSFSPVVGYAGSIVTISGSGFDLTKTNNIVFFGPAQASVTAASATSLQVTVPQGAAFYCISVLNASTGLIAYSPAFFLPSYNGAPYAAGNVNFAPRIDSATGNGPNATKLADFDGDGRDDIVGTNFSDGTIYVRRNTGSSGMISFDAGTTLTSGSGCYMLNVGDIDGDGKLDIAVPNRTAGTISLFRNTSNSGSISFATAVPVTLASASSIAIDDMDGDGKADFVVSRQFGNQVYILRNLSTVGTFSVATAIAYAATAAPVQLTTGDIDGDGQPDIAVACDGGVVNIFRNKSTSGSISMAARQDIAVSGNPNHVKLADIDGDGKTDVLVSSFTSNTLEVLRSTSSIDTISVAAAVTTTVNITPGDISIADFNGDGKPDVVVANSSAGNLSILQNTSVSGSASFAAKVDFAASFGAYGTSTGDLDGDGLPDIAVSCQFTNKLSFFRNSPLNEISGGAMVCTGQTLSLSNAGAGGTWTSSNTSVATVNATTGVVTGVTAGSATITYNGTAGISFAGNRVTKVITVNTSPAITFTAQPGAVAGYSVDVTYTTQGGKSSYAWTVPGTLNTDYSISAGGIGSGSNSVTLKWLTAGFKIVTINYTESNGCAAVSPVSSIGTMVGAPIISGVSPLAAVPGSAVTITGSNFNLTAANNIVYFGAARAAVTTVSTTSLTVTVPVGATYAMPSVTNTSNNFTGYANKLFLAKYNNAAYASSTVNFDKKIDSSTGTSPNATKMADFDGDGKVDIVGVNSGGANIYVYRNTGSAGTISFDNRITLTANTTPYKLSIGDIDGDGKLDIAVPCRGANQVLLYRNTSTTGSISFDNAVVVSVPGGPNGTGIADVDGDGRADILATRVDSKISILRNVGAVGTFSLATSVDFATVSAPLGLAIGDVDADGLPDIAVAGNNSAGTSHVFRNTSTPGNISLAAATEITSALNSNHIGLADIDDDGRADVITADFYSNTISVFRSTSGGSALSFTTAVIAATNSGPADFALADFNGDGKVDISVGNYSSSNLSVILNTSTTGSVSFAGKVDFATLANAYGHSAADLDGDGRADIAVSCQSANKLSILRNNALTPIAGASVVCIGGTAQLSNGAAGGTWTSSNTAIATVSATGLVSGITTGTVTIRYNGTAGINYTGNVVATTISVVARPAVTFTAQPGATANIAGNVTYTTQSGMSSYVWGISGTAGTDYTIVSGGSASDNSTVLMWLTAGSKTVTINYTNANGCTAAAVTSSTATSIQMPPAVTSFTPSVGTTGSTAVITGANFNPTAANNYVYFGPVKALVNSATATSLNVTVPVHAMHNGISVFNTTTALWGRSTADYAPTFSNSGMFTAWPNFDAQITFATGTMPLALAAGDLDGDGKPEIITGNVGTGAISVLRNNAVSGAITASSFNSLQTKTTAGPTFVLSIADIDADGKPDVVASCTNANKVSLFRNTTAAPGSVSLDNAVSINAGTNNMGVATGDIDGDGMIDIVAAGNSSRTIAVLRNTSAPASFSFDAAKSFTVTAAPYDVAIADVDGDGKQDVIVSSNDSAYFSVFRNTSSAGLITFAAATDIRLSSATVRMKWGDVDGDNRLDILVSLNNDTTVVLRNTSSIGAVSFGAELTVAAGERSDFIGFGDLNGDQRPDIAVTMQDENYIAVAMNSSVPGTIKFGPAMPLATGANPSGAVICDMDGDSKMDIVVANQNSNTVSVLRNQPLVLPPVITAVSPASANTNASISITGSNFNTAPANNTVYFGATRATITAASTGSLTVTVPAQATARPVSVRNSSSGLSALSRPFLPDYDNSGDVPEVIRLDPNVTVTGGTAPVEIVLADMDGDGKADLVSSSSGSTRLGVSLNAASQGVLNASSFPVRTEFVTGSQPRGVAVGDLDGDGKPDAVVCNTTSNTISILRNTTSTVGAVTMATKVDIATETSPQYVAIGDLDGDGRPEIAVSCVTGGAVSIFHNRSQSGTINFDPRMNILVGNPRGVVLTDLNNDGMTDLAVARGSGTSVVVYTNTFASSNWLFDGGNTYSTGASTAPRSLLANDFNNDGLTDIVVVNSGAANLMAFRNTSVGSTVSFAGAVTVATGTTPQFLAAADVDGDGRADLAVSNSGSSTVSILRNTSSSGAISFAARIDSATGATPAGVAAGDLDGDGRPDLAICNTGTTTVTLYRTAQMGVITGAGAVCVNATRALSDATSGGLWASSNTAVATIDASGVVTGISAGIATITYTVGAISTTASVTVNPLPVPSFTTQPGATARIANKLVYTTQSGMSGYVWDMTGTAGTDYMISAGGGTGDASVTVKWLTYGAKRVTVNYTNANGCTAATPVSSVATIMLAAPTVTSVSPAAANVATTVTITGTNFSTNPDSNTVYFGATRASVSAAASTQLSVTVPVGATYKAVSVYNAETDLAADWRSIFMPEYDNAPYLPGVINFRRFTTLTTQNTPYGVAIGDLDGDGKPDLVVTNDDVDRVSLYRNISSGGVLSAASFAAAVTLDAGNGVRSVKIADIDGDGKPEVIVGNFDSDDVSVFLNRSVAGSLAFAPEVYFAAGDGVHSLAIGDIDGDGMNDIVVTNQMASTISVLHNTSVIANISFENQVVLPTGNSPRGVELADLDNDGMLDIAAANAPTGMLSVHLNAYPSATYFGAANQFSLGMSGGARGLVAGDFDGDGRIDIAVANENTDSVSIMGNTTSSPGSVTFATPVRCLAGNGAFGLAIGDLDADGKPDIGVASNNGSIRNSSILRNTSVPGAISFAVKIDSAVSGTSHSVAIGDLDGDGKPDMVVTGFSTDRLSILQNNPIAFITGADSICVNATIALSDATAGGEWLSSNTAIATVSASGVVTGVGVGQAIISYSFSGTAATATVNVKPLADPGPISGSLSICHMSTSVLSTGAAGGVWSSSNTGIATVSVAGEVSAVATGTVNVLYTKTNSCGSMSAQATVTVIPLANPGALSGAATVCEGSTRLLSSSAAGGVWSSANTAAAAVSATGIVTGVAAGTAAVSYTATNSCGDVSAVMTMTVLATPPSITGVNIMAPFHSDTLSNAGGPGTWSSSAPVIATIHAATGIVAALAPGTTVIRFTNANGCSADTSLVVSAGNMVCVGQTIVLSNDGVSGGTWTSGSGSIAKVAPTTGVVTGMGTGRVIMYYILPSGAFRTATVTVNALSQITGATSVCQTFTSTVANVTPGGGYWSCTDPQATINSAGVISGISSGVVTIYYTTNQGCVATRTITVYPTAPITGVANTVCASQAIVLTNGLAGGSWSTSSNALATVNNVGLVRGVAAGVPRVSYIWPNGCHMTYSVTVNALSQIGGGTAGMCQSSSMTLTNATPYGGVWSSSNPAAATISTSGVVRGTAPGTTVISFTSGVSGCVATKTVTINACRVGDTTGEQTTEVAAVVEGAFDLKLFPNPNTGSFVLRGMAGTADGELAIEVVNMTGQVVYRGKVQVQNGSIDARIDVDGQLPAGMYVLNAIGEHDRRTFHFILQR